MFGIWFWIVLIVVIGSIILKKVTKSRKSHSGKYIPLIEKTLSAGNQVGSVNNTVDDSWAAAHKKVMSIIAEIDSEESLVRQSP